MGGPLERVGHNRVEHSSVWEERAGETKVLCETQTNQLSFGVNLRSLNVQFFAQEHLMLLIIKRFYE